MKRVLGFLYGFAAYGFFFVTLLYTIAFVGGLFVPKTVDDGLAASLPLALAIDLGLVALFGLHHSLAARPTFKRAVTRFVPRHLERSTYVLVSTALWAFLVWQWRPIPAVVWDVQEPIVRGLFWAAFAGGWVLLLTASFVIDHFDLFGLRQVWLHLRGREYTPPAFALRAYYRYLRHPLMLAWLLGFWAAPTMTVGHLVFALANSAYIAVGVFFEERTLEGEHGEAYREYKRRVPALVPFTKSASRPTPSRESRSEQTSTGQGGGHRRSTAAG